MSLFSPQPFGTIPPMSAPSRDNLKINVGDIIKALQASENASEKAKRKLEEEQRAMAMWIPKPVDLREKNKTMYYVAHKTFENGEVYQASSSLYMLRKDAESSLAKLEEQQWGVMNPITKFYIVTVQVSDISESIPEPHGNSHSMNSQQIPARHQKIDDGFQNDDILWEN